MNQPLQIKIVFPRSGQERSVWVAESKNETLPPSVQEPNPREANLATRKELIPNSR